MNEPAVIEEGVNFRGSTLYKQMMIALYIRFENCLIHYSDNFEEYLKAWDYWKKIVKSEMLP